MTISPELLAAARRAEAASGVSAAALLAVSLVETGGRAGTPIDGRMEPLIRFEGHYFDRLLSDERRRVARLAGLSHPKAGRIRNPSGQAARWSMLRRASAIDREAAFSSTSWGLGQVMGSHWKRLGFESAAALSDAARASPAGQLDIAARFLKVGRLAERLSAGDFAGFARLYNGPGYRRNAYDTKIRDAWRVASRALAAQEGVP